MRKRLSVAVLILCILVNSFGMNVLASTMTNRVDELVDVQEETKQTSTDVLQAADCVEINETNFPDEIFRKYVSEYCDANKDSVLSKAEIENVTYINCSGEYKEWSDGAGITTLKGVEFFTKLETLYCGTNQLSSLDVSKNTNLTSLDCNYNQISSLDVSGNLNLSRLICYYNQLTELDVSKNIYLSDLNCAVNQLTELDVSKNMYLTSLDCNQNPLTELDVSGNLNLSRLSCYNNQLTELDVRKNTNLTSLECGCNQLSSLDVSKNKNLTSLGCCCNQLSSLDVSKNMNLTSLDCNQNQLSELDVSRNLNLSRLSCYNNQLTSLDLSGNLNLSRLNCGCNQLSSLDVSNNRALVNLSCDYNQLEELDIRNNTELYALICCGNSIDKLDISHCSYLLLAIEKGVKEGDSFTEVWQIENPYNYISASYIVLHVDKNIIIKTVDQAPRIWFTFYPDTEKLTFYQDKGYAQKSFNLDISAMCMVGRNDEVPPPCENVTVEITLPEGLSFEQKTDKRVFTKNLGTMSLEGNKREDMSFKIYIYGKVAQEKFVIQAKLTADGYEEAQNSSFTMPVTVVWPSDGWHAEYKNATTYQASYIYDEQTNFIENAFYGRTPSSRIYEQAEQKGLVNSTNAWRDLQDTLKMVDDVSSVLDMPCRKKDLYQGIIFSIFESSSELSDYTYYTSDVKDVKSILGTIKENVKTKYGITVAEDNDLSLLTKEQRLKLSEVTEAYFNDEWKTNVQTKDVSDIFDAIEYIDDALEYVEYAVNCYELREMSEGYKAVLHDMYINCPADNMELLAALSDCIASIEASEMALLAKMKVHEIGVVGKKVIQAGLSEMWKEVKSEVIATNPYVALFWVSYKSSTFLSNKMFASDAIAEKTVKMGALLDIRQLIQAAYEQEKRSFSRERNEGNAIEYLAAIDIFYQYLNEDCKTAYSFTDTASNSIMGQIQEFMGCKTYEDTLSTINIYQSNYKAAHDATKKQWLYILEEDYPSEYVKYKNVWSESDKQVNKKYHVACPVDVYVYDLNGELVASVIGDAVECKENVPITIMVVGEEKYIYFHENDGEYSIKYVGTDEGTMDITIEEFDDEQLVSRGIKHIEIPVKEGVTYQSTENLGVECTYLLENNSSPENKISPIADTKKEGVKKYTLQVSGGYVLEENRIGQKAEYYSGEKATVYAVASEGYDFVHWIEDGEVVSKEATYTFTMDADKHLKAVFKEKENSKVTDIFEDVKEGAWYVGAVQFAYDNGIMAGMGEVFQPNGKLTREQFVQVLYNNSGKPAVTIENKFPDVKNAWYKNAVLWANANDIANGKGNGDFGVTESISRQDLALMLYKYARMNGYDLTANTGEIGKYADGNKVSSYAKTAMDWAITKGVLSGKGKKGEDISTFKLDPTGTATRAECAAMLKNFMEAYGK